MALTLSAIMDRASTTSGPVVHMLSAVTLLTTGLGGRQHHDVMSIHATPSPGVVPKLTLVSWLHATPIPGCVPELTVVSWLQSGFEFIELMPDEVIATPAPAAPLTMYP